MFSWALRKRDMAGDFCDKWKVGEHLMYRNFSISKVKKYSSKKPCEWNQTNCSAKKTISNTLYSFKSNTYHELSFELKSRLFIIKRKRCLKKYIFYMFQLLSHVYLNIVWFSRNRGSKNTPFDAF